MCVCVVQVQSDQYIPAEDIHGEMGELEKQLDELEQRGVALERELRDNPNGKAIRSAIVLHSWLSYKPLQTSLMIWRCCMVPD